jgi:hypothetical protein
MWLEGAPRPCCATTPGLAQGPAVLGDNPTGDRSAARAVTGSPCSVMQAVEGGGRRGNGRDTQVLRPLRSASAASPAAVRAAY